MLKTLAVAKHVFRESLRKRILFILGLFFLILLVSSLFLETVSQEDKIKLVERISFGSLAFFGVMAAIFLPATSLPGEIEEKLIQVVMTKPIGRLNFLLGKMLGFISVIGLLFLLMGTLSWALIQVTAQGKSLSAKRSFSPQGLTFSGEDMGEVKLLEDAARKGEVSWLKGAQDIRAIWRWEEMEGNLPQGEATFRVVNTTPTGGARRTELEIRCFFPEGEVASKETSFRTEVRKITVKSEEPVKFEFDLKAPRSKGSIGSRRAFRVEVRRLNLDYAIGVKKESLKILAPPGSFHFNFLKGLLLLFFELILMVVITVMGSTFLSSAVTITLAFFVYFAGHMIEFLKTVLRTIAATGVMVVSHQHGPMEAGEHSRWLTEVFEFFLYWFTKLFPNLGRFEVSSSIIDGVDVSPSLVVDSFFYMSLYAAIALIIAYLFFRRKEFR